MSELTLTKSFNHVRPLNSFICNMNFREWSFKFPPIQMVCMYFYDLPRGKKCLVYVSVSVNDIVMIVNKTSSTELTLFSIKQAAPRSVLLCRDHRPSYHFPNISRRWVYFIAPREIIICCKIISIIYWRSTTCKVLDICYLMWSSKVNCETGCFYYPHLKARKQIQNHYHVVSK